MAKSYPIFKQRPSPGIDPGRAALNMHLNDWGQIDTSSLLAQFVSCQSQAC